MEREDSCGFYHWAKVLSPYMGRSSGVDSLALLHFEKRAKLRLRNLESGLISVAMNMISPCYYAAKPHVNLNGSHGCYT